MERATRTLMAAVMAVFFVAASVAWGAEEAEVDEWEPSPELQAQAHEYNKETIALWKDLREMLFRGMLIDEDFQDTKFGCRHPRFRAWVKRWEKHYKSRPNIPPANSYLLRLPTTVESVVYPEDLGQIVRGPTGAIGYLRRHQFDLAMICFEHPEICREYELKWSEEEQEEHFRMFDEALKKKGM